MVKKIIMCLFVFLMISISCKAADRSETLSWDQVISSDFAGWRMYMSNESGANYAFIPNEDHPTLTLVYTPDMVEPYTLELTLAIPVGVPYDVYFVATALDLVGNESEYSNEATKSYFIPFPTTIPPTTTIPVDDVPPEDPYNLIISMMYWQYRTITLDLT